MEVKPQLHLVAVWKFESKVLKRSVIIQLYRTIVWFLSIAVMEMFTLDLPYAGNVTGRVYKIKKTKPSNFVILTGVLEI